MNKKYLVLLPLSVVFLSVSCTSSSSKPAKTRVASTSAPPISTPTPDTGADDIESRARELQDEITIGREVAAKLLGTFGDLNERKRSTEYLNLIVQGLAEQAGRPEIIYRVGILDTDEINAFAAPGGYILVTKGLLNNIQNEQELAGVLAHEMGHINHRHLFKEVAPKREISAGETLSRLLSRGGANVSMAFGQAVSKGMKTLTDEGLKPELEYEADQSGVEYSWATGYDPRYFRQFMERLAKTNAGNTKKLLKTHPSFEDRLQRLDGHLKGLGLENLPPDLSNEMMVKRFSVLANKK
jgi:predicted Zn-dependent protease